MNVTYDIKVEKILIDDKKLQKIVNKELAKLLRKREEQIKAFDNFLDFLNLG